MEHRKAIIISVVNNKGGVGKTSVAVNTGYALARLGHKVGLIDFDSQKNLSFNISYNGGSNLSTCMKNKSIKFEDFGVSENSNLFVLPNQGDVSVQLFNQFATDEQPYLLMDCLEKLEPNSFDYIIIDTPPNLELQTVNGLIVSDYVLIPCLLETNSVMGVQNTLKAIERISSRLNTNLKILGLLISKYDERLTSTNKPLISNLEEMLGSDKLIFRTRIRTNSNYSKNQLLRQSIFEDKTDSKGSQDFTELALEITKRIKNN